MANELAYFLRRIGARDVNCLWDQVVELIGEAKTEELHNFRVDMSQVKTARVGPRSAIAPKKRIETSGLVNFNRRALLAAIEEAQGANFQKDGTEPAIELKDIPNLALLPKKKQRELEVRGLTKDAIS